MGTIIGVIGITALFGCIYLVIKYIDRNPRCPECGAEMTHEDGDEDESGREVWTCKHCGERLLL